MFGLLIFLVSLFIVLTELLKMFNIIIYNPIKPLLPNYYDYFFYLSVGFSLEYLIKRISQGFRGLNKFLFVILLTLFLIGFVSILKIVNLNLPIREIYLMLPFIGYLLGLIL